MKKRVQLSLILFLSAVYLNAQNNYSQTIRGVVIDAITEIPLHGASVVLLNSNPLKGTTTNEKGEFRLDHLILERQSIQVSFVGYSTVTLNNLIINSGKELVVTVKLDEKVIQAEGVVVKAYGRKDRPINEMALVSARSFTIEETERYAGSWGDPSRMAANYAGVSSSTDQRNDIIIRGNSPQGLLWRIEGVDIPSPNHFASLGSTGGPMSMLNNNLLSNSDFYTGAFPAEFGNALSGAFDLKMRAGNNEKYEFLGQVGFNGFEFGAEGPFSKNHKASFLVNTRYSTIGVFNAIGMDFGLATAVPNYQDISFKIDIPLSNYRKFSVFGIGGKSYIAMLESKLDPSKFSLGGMNIYAGSTTGILGMNYTCYLTPKTSLRTELSATSIEITSKIDSLWRNKVLGIYPSIDEKTIDSKCSLSVKLNAKYNSRNNQNSGITFDLFNINYRGKHYDYLLGEFINHMNVHGNIKMLSAYSQWQHKFSDNLIANTGIHTNYLFLNQSWSIEPRLGLKWSLNDKQSLNFGFGLLSQTQLKALYLGTTLVDTINLRYEQTNKDLGFTKSLQFVLGFDCLVRANLRLKIETYFQHLYDVPVTPKQREFSMLNPFDDFLSNNYPYMVNKGKGTNYGIEITFEKFLNSGLYYLFTTSIFNSKYSGYDNIERNSANNNNYIFNLLAGYEFKVGNHGYLAFDIKGVEGGGRRYLSVEEEKSKQQFKPVYDWGNAYKNRFNDYFKINCRVTYKINRNKLNHEFAIEVANVTNHRNIYAQFWDVKEERLKTINQFGFFPIMLYRIQF